MKLKEFGICYTNSLMKNIACYVIKKLAALEIILMSLNTELIKFLILTFFAILQENEMLSVYTFILFLYIFLFNGFVCNVLDSFRSELRRKKKLFKLLTFFRQLVYTQMLLNPHSQYYP